jgi:hypothetical protein
MYIVKYVVKINGKKIKTMEYTSTNDIKKIMAFLQRQHDTKKIEIHAIEETDFQYSVL